MTAGSVDTICPYMVCGGNILITWSTHLRSIIRWTISHSGRIPACSNIASCTSVASSINDVVLRRLWRRSGVIGSMGIAFSISVRLMYIFRVCGWCTSNCLVVIWLFYLMPTITDPHFRDPRTFPVWLVPPLDEKFSWLVSNNFSIFWLMIIYDNNWWHNICYCALITVKYTPYYKPHQ